MAVRLPDVVEVIGPQAFLRGRRPREIVDVSQELAFELLHPGRREQHRRIVLGNKRIARGTRWPLLAKKSKYFFRISCPVMEPFPSRFSSQTFGRKPRRLKNQTTAVGQYWVRELDTGADAAARFLRRRCLIIISTRIRKCRVDRFSVNPFLLELTTDPSRPNGR